MARGDGIDRTNARNMRLTETKIGNTQQHNEREKDSYVNQDTPFTFTLMSGNVKGNATMMFSSSATLIHPEL